MFFLCVAAPPALNVMAPGPPSARIDGKRDTNIKDQVWRESRDEGTPHHPLYVNVIPRNLTLISNLAFDQSDCLICLSLSVWQNGNTCMIIYVCIYVCVYICICMSLEHRSSTAIFVAIDNNTLYGSKLYIFLLCQKSLGY